MCWYQIYFAVVQLYISDVRVIPLFYSVVWESDREMMRKINLLMLSHSNSLSDFTFYCYQVGRGKVLQHFCCSSVLISKVPIGIIF